MENLPADMIKHIMSYVESAIVQYVVCLVNRRFYKMLCNGSNKPAAAIALGKYINDKDRAKVFGFDESHLHYLVCRGPRSLASSFGVEGVKKRGIPYIIKYNNIDLLSGLVIPYNVEYLRIAIEYGHYEIAKMLFHIFAKKCFDDGLINYALVSPSMECCELFVEKLRESDQYTSMLYIDNGKRNLINVNNARYIIYNIGKDHVELINLSAVDEDCYNFMRINHPFHDDILYGELCYYALIHHNFALAKFLNIESGRIIEDRTILMWLIEDDNIESVKYVIKKINTLNYHVCVSNCPSVEMLETLLTAEKISKASIDSVAVLAKRGRIDLIEKLHEHDIRGDSRAVLAAAKAGYHKCMKFLISEGYGVPADIRGVKDKKCRKFLEQLAI